MKLGRVLAALGLLGALGALGLVCDRVAARGRFAAHYSSYGSGPEGTRGLFLLADSLGGGATRWAEDLGRLRPGGMLVVLGGCDSNTSRPPTRFEKEKLVQWVRAGGVLLVAGVRDFVPDELGVSLRERHGECSAQRELERLFAGEDAPPEKDDPIVPSGADEYDPPTETFVEDPASRIAQALRGVPLTPPTWGYAHEAPLAGLGPVPLRDPGRIVVNADAEATTILDDDDDPLGVIVERGEGRVIVLASASVLQNRELGPSDGGPLFARLLSRYAPRGPVIFDEYHVGVGERRSAVRYLGQLGAGPLALQALIVLAVLLWRFGARFGSVRPELVRTPAGTASYVGAVGTLYAKAKDPVAALELLVRHALTKVAAHHHVATTDAALLTKHLQDRGDHVSADAVRTLAQLAIVAPGTRPDLLARSRELDATLARALAK